MREMEILSMSIESILIDLENLRFQIIDLIEKNVINGMSALRPSTLIVQTQIINLVAFLKEMLRLMK